MDKLFDESISLSSHYIHLTCSPSRSQFLTGRYAMYSGQGRIQPWDTGSIGSIPIGQPLIANWLKEYSSYNTYYVGKWHLGILYM